MDDLKFEDCWRLNVFWFAVSIAALIAGFVFGWCWRDRPGALAEVRVLDVLTAIGTVGATCVALLLAMAEGRRRKTDALRKAQLVAVILRPRMVLIRTKLALLYRQVQEDGDCLSRPESRHEIREEIIAPLRDLISLSEAESMVPAPDNCGDELAELVAILEYFLGLLAFEGETGSNRSFEMKQLRDGQDLAAELSVRFRSANSWI